MPDYIERYQAEWKLIYSVIVAGKSAKFTEGVMDRLSWLWLEGVSCSPLEGIAASVRSENITNDLKKARSGSYTRLSKCFTELATVNALTVTLEELEAIHGIGPKTARFFLMWTNPLLRYAALDTHVLKYLRSLGHDAPKSTPPAGEKYRQLENIFIAEADRQNKTPRELDIEVWEKYSNAE